MADSGGESNITLVFDSSMHPLDEASESQDLRVTGMRKLERTVLRHTVTPTRMLVQAHRGIITMTVGVHTNQHHNISTGSVIVYPVFIEIGMSIFTAK